MGKYKEYSYEQKVLLPIDFSEQVLPGTFEHTLNFLIDREIDLTMFYEKHKNDENGVPAYDPAILLKIILFAYSRGIISSRRIARLCRENVVCMSLSADTRPHFSTIADFISTMDKEIAPLFTRILSVCYANNVIDKNMFAIDGCKISSNCSKEWSGTKKELLKKAGKIEESIKYLLEKHKQEDKSRYSQSQEEKEKASIEKLKAKSQKIHDWLNSNDDRMGSQGKPIKSNITDNESAKMSTSHGVIQGYNGIAAVDEKNQLIVWAEAFGDSNESKHFPEILDGIKNNFKSIQASEDILKETVITADSGFHNDNNMKLIVENNLTAFVADNQFRKRDVRFASAQKHKQKPVTNWEPAKGKKYYSVDDFIYDENTKKLMCPAGFERYLIYESVPNYPIKITFDIDNSTMISKWIFRSLGRIIIHFLSTIIIIYLIRKFLYMLNDLIKTQKELEILARFDSLTGVMNRRYFFERLQEEIIRTIRYKHDMAVLSLDIDYHRCPKQGLLIA